jgi:hypothetical protein
VELASAVQQLSKTIDRQNYVIGKIQNEFKDSMLSLRSMLQTHTSLPLLSLTASTSTPGQHPAVK